MYDVLRSHVSRVCQVGKVCKDQVADYSARKGMTMEEGERWLGPYLAYDPAA